MVNKPLWDLIVNYKGRYIKFHDLVVNRINELKKIISVDENALFSDEKRNENTKQLVNLLTIHKDKINVCLDDLKKLSFCLEKNYLYNFFSISYTFLQAIVFDKVFMLITLENPKKVISIFKEWYSLADKHDFKSHVKLIRSFVMYLHYVYVSDYKKARRLLLCFDNTALWILKQYCILPQDVYINVESCVLSDQPPNLPVVKLFRVLESLSDISVLTNFKTVIDYLLDVGVWHKATNIVFIHYAISKSGFKTFLEYWLGIELNLNSSAALTYDFSNITMTVNDLIDLASIYNQQDLMTLLIVNFATVNTNIQYYVKTSWFKLSKTTNIEIFSKRLDLITNVIDYITNHIYDFTSQQLSYLSSSFVTYVCIELLYSYFLAIKQNTINEKHIKIHSSVKRAIDVCDAFYRTPYFKRKNVVPFDSKSYTKTIHDIYVSINHLYEWPIEVYRSFYKILIHVSYLSLSKAKNSNFELSTLFTYFSLSLLTKDIVKTLNVPQQLKDIYFLQLFYSLLHESNFYDVDSLHHLSDELRDAIADNTNAFIKFIKQHLELSSLRLNDIAFGSFADVFSYLLNAGITKIFISQTFVSNLLHLRAFNAVTELLVANPDYAIRYITEYTDGVFSLKEVIAEYTDHLIDNPKEFKKLIPLLIKVFHVINVNDILDTVSMFNYFYLLALKVLATLLPSFNQIGGEIVELVEVLTTITAKIVKSDINMYAEQFKRHELFYWRAIIKFLLNNRKEVVNDVISQGVRIIIGYIPELLENNEQLRYILITYNEGGIQ